MYLYDQETHIPPFIQVDETEWTQLVQSFSAARTVYFFDDNNFPPYDVDEDYWSQVVQSSPTWQSLYWFDAGEIYVAPLDETEWRQTVQFAIQQQLYLFEDEPPAGSLFNPLLIDDADYWQLVSPRWLQNNNFVWGHPDEPLMFLEDEYWWINSRQPTKQPDQFVGLEEDGGSDLFSQPRVLPAVPGFTRYMTEADRIEWYDRRIEKNKLPPQ